LNSNPLNLALTWKAGVCFHQNALSSLLSKRFFFKGAIEYLEELVTFIDVPQLNTLRMTFFDQIDSDCPWLI
jgi:hypothetical protein